MKRQRNLLLIPGILGILMGTVGIITPQYFIQFYDVPVEHITPSFIVFTIILGISLLSLGIVSLWLRTIKDKLIMRGAMTISAIIFLLFGLESILETLLVKGAFYSKISTYQGIAFLFIALGFALSRNTKDENV